MASEDKPAGRRGFLQRMMTLAGVSAAAPVAGRAQAGGAGTAGSYPLPDYARAHTYRSLKQSSHDRTGGNADRWQIPPGGTQELFNSEGPGVITHIWFTIAAQSTNHLKELVLRAYWDGNTKPSVETPVGDFFGLNLGQYQIYQSAYLACSPGRSLNCYFSMPFRKSARMTVTNEGKAQVGAFYSNIDYVLAPSLAADALYFHAQYRQCSPCVANKGDRLNPTGAQNYVYMETRGRGHLMGVTLGVLLNADGWMGEGDDMIFVDDESKPVIIGTGSEDYFLGSWNFGGRDGATPFAHHYYGAPLIIMAERTGGRYCCYRWHGDNPVTFNHYLKHTMEHGHANDRGDNFFSVAYWYQGEPYTEFPALPPLEERIPRVRLEAGAPAAGGPARATVGRPSRRWRPRACGCKKRAAVRKKENRKMRLKLSILFVLAGAVVMGAEPPGFAHWRGPELKGLEKKLAPKIDAKKVATEPLGKFGNHAFQVTYRAGSGEAEVHDTQTDIFIVQNGDASLVVGGEVVGGKTTAPGETRGTSIKGGQKRKLGPGDVVNIPAKTPHQVLVEPGRQFTYMIVKVDTP